jgi:hypothetical protein
MTVINWKGCVMKNLIIGLLVLIISVSVQAREVAGVELPEQAKVGGESLVLNGAGIRKKFFVKVYVGALYLPGKTADANKAITMPGARRVTMDFIYDEVEVEKLINGWEEGFASNENGQSLGKLRSRLDRFNSFFETMKAGDQVIFDYVPGTGVEVMVKGGSKGTIEGEDFMQALLRVWLGSKPADKGLKSGMLDQ